jgi:hypothetical protein
MLSLFVYVGYTFLEVLVYAMCVISSISGGCS